MSVGAVRLIRTRAMNRALATLRDKYRDEYELLLAAELERAWAEAGRQVTSVPAAVQHPVPQRKPGARGPAPTPRPPVPPRLVPGPRPGGAAGPRLRDDVGRCPYCVAAHDRGHRCRICGSAPAGAPGPRRSYQRVDESA